MKKRQYRISVEWASYGTIYVEAKNLKEAMKIAEEDDSIELPEANYIDGTFKVNDDITLQKALNE